MSDDGSTPQRRAWTSEPTAAEAATWLVLSDDELLFKVEQIDGEHLLDALLLEIVASDRHFFIRQEAAKRIRDKNLLKAHSGDRHIGQILARTMTRREDAAYLERMITESRHIEVKKAAEAQLKTIVAKLTGGGKD